MSQSHTLKQQVSVVERNLVSDSSEGSADMQTLNRATKFSAKPPYSISSGETDASKVMSSN